MMTMIDIEMTNKRKMVVSPARYLRLLKTAKENIESVRILPPQIGKRGFGNLLIVYREPIWRAK